MADTGVFTIALGRNPGLTDQYNNLIVMGVFMVTGTAVYS